MYLHCMHVGHMNEMEHCLLKYGVVLIDHCVKQLG